MRSFPLKVVGLLIGSFVGWLVGWLVRWLVGWFVGWLVGSLVGSLEPVDRELFDRDQSFFLGTFAAGFKQLHD